MTNPNRKAARLPLIALALLLCSSAGQAREEKPANPLDAHTASGTTRAGTSVTARTRYGQGEYIIVSPPSKRTHDVRRQRKDLVQNIAQQSDEPVVSRSSTTKRSRYGELDTVLQGINVLGAKP